jgi:nitroimidazol reductase NimA-like FMN-containing flavoprotein (pyridoxamine 5'-phosphate oxidase superfamily)
MKESTMTDEVQERTKQELIDELLSLPVLARLATTNASTLQPHVVPLWFLWDGSSAWISSFVSTRKMRDLSTNQNAALLVEPKIEGFKLQAVLLEGTAEVITEPREFVASQSLKIYTHYLGPQGVLAADPQAWAVDPENRLIKLTPRRIIAW